MHATRARSNLMSDRGTQGPTGYVPLEQRHLKSITAPDDQVCTLHGFLRHCVANSQRLIMQVSLSSVLTAARPLGFPVAYGKGEVVASATASPLALFYFYFTFI